MIVIRSTYPASTTGRVSAAAQPRPLGRNLENNMRVALSLAFVLIVAGCAHSPSPKPEQIAIGFYNSWSQCNWEGIAASLHPDQLKEFKDSIIANYKQCDPRDSISRAILHLDRALAIVGDSTIQALAPDQFFVRYMNNAVPPSLLSGLTSEIQTRYQSIGSLPEGPDTLHVLTRVLGTWRGASSNQIKLLTLKRLGSEWRVLLPDGVMNTIRRSVPKITGK